MWAESGYIALMLVAGFALIQVAFFVWSELRHQQQWLRFNPLLTLLQSLCALYAFACLAYAFLTDDFTLSYVSAHSNRQLPAFFKFAASWGGHEGSMLFWLTALALWSGIFCIFSGKIDRLFRQRTLAFLAIIVLGFSLFILWVSSPFDRAFPPAPEGRDLNPMLQDIGLIFHPPLLYLGYVGFAITFAMTLAMLLEGVVDFALIHWIRPWAMIAWGFLTAGIVLGGWWAYYELGWGGWWFWDPVENASLMPWLLGTALIHSLIVSEQRGIFSYWTILLAIFTFALSLLGTFIVRSGVLTSVHAFAVDTQRGTALLLLFFALSFIALAIFAVKTKIWQGQVYFHWLSKESAILWLNGLFVLATCVVVLGTFYPMVFSAMNWGTISVGAPYFNTIFTPLVILLMGVMGLASYLVWKQMPLKVLFRPLLCGVVAITLTLLWSLRQTALFSPFSFCFVSLAVWIILTHLPYRLSMWKIRPLTMRLAHIGFAVCVIGAVMNSEGGDEIGVRLKPQQQASLGNFRFEYQHYSNEIGANYTAERAIFQLYDNQNQQIATLAPERRYYDVRSMTMTEVGLAHLGLDDVYIVMGDKLGQKEYAFRLHYKPYIRLLWLGGIMLVCASLLALFGRIYRSIK